MKKNKPNTPKPPVNLSETVVDITDEAQMRRLIDEANQPRPVSGIVIEDKMAHVEAAAEPPQTGNPAPIIEAELTEIQEGDKAAVKVEPKPEKVVTIRGGSTPQQRLAFKKNNLKNMIERRDSLNKSIKRAQKDIAEYEKALKFVEEN